MGVELVGLRCVKCGAPLPQPEKGSEYVRCEYCGTVQRVVDASQYTERLKSEIYSWIRELLPVSTVGVQTIDVLARHNIFIANIKPRILPEYASLKAKVLKLLSTPLVLPRGIGLKPDIDDPRKAFEKLARVESLSQMVVVDEDREFYSGVYATYVLNAHLSNYVETALSGDIDAAVRNLEKLAESLPGAGVEEAVLHRVKGVANAMKAWSSLEKGDYTSAMPLLETASLELSKARSLASGSPQLAMMLPPVDVELKLVEAMRNIAECEKALFEAGRQPQEAAAFIARYIRTVEEVRSRVKRDIGVYLELSESLKSLYLSRLGRETVEVLPGEGEVALPLYVVSISYTFVTGSLVWKKGREYRDHLLVLATHPYASKPVTDTFRLTSGFLDRLKGREEKLTVDTVSKALSTLKRDHLRVPAVPPLIDRAAAEALVDSYLANVSSRLQGKVKTGASHTEKLIYAPARIRGGDIYIEALGETQVALGPHLDVVLKLAVR